MILVMELIEKRKGTSLGSAGHVNRLGTKLKDGRYVAQLPKGSKSPHDDAAAAL